MSNDIATLTPPAQPTDDALILAAQAGSEEAFCALVRLHQGAVRAFVARYACEGSVIDDIAQECFLAAYRDLARYDGRGPFRTWLLGIARHRALTWLRTETRRRAHEPLRVENILLSVAPRMESEEDLDAEERRLLALRSCVEQLPSHSADLVQAHYRDGQDASELADRSGRSEPAVRMALMRVRRLLRDCIERRIGPAHG